jgi:uncharacterized protein (TIGR00255 family)
MTVSSMTGFARIAGADAHYYWTWEIKTVNAKGLDIRLRLPPPFEDIEISARAQIAATLARGACQAALTVSALATTPTVRINHDILAAVIAAISTLSSPLLRPPSFDGLLNIRGAVEIGDSVPDASAQADARAGVMATLSEALAALQAMRRREGQALCQLVEMRLAAIDRLRLAADAAPSRLPEAIKARLLESITELIDISPSLDPNRLHQEAMLLAAKADIREELDRLKSHVEASRTLLAEGGPIGRRLDFLAQEFGREANTLCAKSNSIAVTAIGLDLKAEIEQLREQIQNIE